MKNWCQTNLFNKSFVSLFYNVCMLQFYVFPLSLGLAIKQLFDLDFHSGVEKKPHPSLFDANHQHKYSPSLTSSLFLFLTLSLALFSLRLFHYFISLSLPSLFFSILYLTNCPSFNLFIYFSFLSLSFPLTTMMQTFLHQIKSLKIFKSVQSWNLIIFAKLLVKHKL